MNFIALMPTRSRLTLILSAWAAAALMLSGTVNHAQGAPPPAVAHELPASTDNRTQPATRHDLHKARPEAAAVMPDGIYVRIIAFARAFNPGWSLEGHSAQDVLRIIGELKPDVINRLLTGMPTPHLKVPVAAGTPDMTQLEFLNAAMRAGGSRCTISPKVHLNAIWSDAYRMRAAQELRDLPLAQPLTMLDLDCWFEDPKATAANRQVLEKLKQMGWTTLVTNPGVYKRAYGHESAAMTYMRAQSDWKVPAAPIKALQQKGIRLPLLHIDYPEQIAEFKELPPDRQADIISKEIRPAQRKLGFRFIYPILASGYDSTRFRTSQNGPHQGRTLYEVMKQCIEEDRREMAQPATRTP